MYSCKPHLLFSEYFTYSVELILSSTRLSLSIAFQVQIFLFPLFSYSVYNLSPNDKIYIMKFFSLCFFTHSLNFSIVVYFQYVCKSSYIFSVPASLLRFLFLKLLDFYLFSIYGKGFYHRIFHLPYHQHIELCFLNCPRVKASSLSNSFSTKYFLLKNFVLPDFGFPLKTHPPPQLFPFSSEIIYIGELFILSYLKV